MAASARGCSRRLFLFSGLAAPLLAQEKTGANFPPEVKRYEDPSTELEVYRLTDPGHSSMLPAHYNRAISQYSAWMIFCCDRGGEPQAFRMDLKTGETRELTPVEDLDGSSLTLTPDNRSLCFFSGRILFITGVGGRARQLYQVPDGWDRSEGLSR